MSVVGLTFGIAAKASRPTTGSAARAATTATTRAGGRPRSYQAKPAARASARRTRETAPPARAATRLRIMSTFTAYIAVKVDTVAFRGRADGAQTGVRFLHRCRQ